jgi:FkbM family methyltransferase
MLRNWELVIPEGEQAGWWIENAYEILNRYQGSGKTFVDIGAHIGVESIIAVKERGFDKAIAIEPALENDVKLLDNIAINDCEGYILPLWAAISNDPPLTRLTLRYMGPNSGTFGLGFSDHLKGQQVMTLTLGNIYDMIGYPDFLKVDIEGGEWGFIDQLNSKYIDIELHSDKKKQLKEARAILGQKYNLEKNPNTNGFYGHSK